MVFKKKFIQNWHLQYTVLI